MYLSIGGNRPNSALGQVSMVVVFNVFFFFYLIYPETVVRYLLGTLLVLALILIHIMWKLYWKCLVLNATGQQLLHNRESALLIWSGYSMSTLEDSIHLVLLQLRTCFQ